MTIALILGLPALPALSAPPRLPDTEALDWEGDLSLALLESADRFLLKLTEQSAESRESWWKRDYSSVESYLKSIAKNRARFRQVIGLKDPRHSFDRLDLVQQLGEPAFVAETDSFTIRAVRWPAFDQVSGEGLLLDPRGPAKAFVIALPDADWTPEMLSGLAPAPLPRADFARRLAQAGCRVLVPAVINRKDAWSGNAAIRMLNQPHREFLYRPAFYLGRHLIGYEIQKVLSAVDFFSRENSRLPLPLKIGVAGYGEGGLIAFYCAAADERISAAMVSGHFQPRENLWREPVWRNVWGLLREFGDAEIASLVAPRGLVIEACQGIEWKGPPPPRDGRNEAASGAHTHPALTAVQAEFQRARRHFDLLQARETCELVMSENGLGPPGSDAALQRLLEMLGVPKFQPRHSTGVLKDNRMSFDPNQRMKRQFDELAQFNQTKFWESGRQRARFWAKTDSSSPSNWLETSKPYRQLLLQEVIGDWPIESSPPRPRTRLIYETPHWNGYEVVLDVTPGLWSYGILLLPNDFAHGERRPVVVAQHGRGGRPQDLCDPSKDHRSYHAFGARLADRGWIVYAPQNLYLGEEKYRLIQRKANPLGMSFFAPMVWQHRAVLQWLGALPWVDAQRIGFYGLSYGGKSALLIPAVLEQYAVSLCSGAFTDTVRKHVDAVGGNTAVFLFTGEYEHLEFDFAERFNHAELAWLISPRPFMVEKGHWDGGLPDEWTAYEYARVRRHYARLGLGERTDLELFDGGHEIHLKGTLKFLESHLGPVRRLGVVE